jgi:hypothetical protein
MRPVHKKSGRGQIRNLFAYPSYLCSKSWLQLSCMKHAHHIILAAIICMSIAACGDKSATTTPPLGAGNPGPNNGKAPMTANTMAQIPAQEVLGSKTERYLRYQPQDEMNEYLDDPKALDLYLAQISSVIRRNVGRLPTESPCYGTIVIGMNAQGRRRVWYSFPEHEPSATLKAAVQAAVDEVVTPPVKKELIVVGVAFTFWNYKESYEQANHIILPKEWQEAGKAFSTPQKATKLAQLTWDKAGA